MSLIRQTNNAGDLIGIHVYAGYSFTFLLGAKMKDVRNCGYNAGVEELRCTISHMLSLISESNQGQQEYQYTISD